MATIKPKNLTAQLSHRARGNPESTQPMSAISNCFPGLEYDLKNLWKNIFEEIELHETGSRVIDGGRGGHRILDVKPGSDPEAKGVGLNNVLLSVDGEPFTQALNFPGSIQWRGPIEFSNALARVLVKQGQKVTGIFQIGPNGQPTEVSAELTVRRVISDSTISEALAEPGALSQGLCSPWQADYRECGCTYWAASRPDFVNADTDAAGNTTGHNWMQSDRQQDDTYRVDPGGHDSSGSFITYDDLYTRWEEVLRFVIKGKDTP